MTRIFVNGISAKSAGGKSVLSNFLQGISNQTAYYFIVLVPDDPHYLKFRNRNIEIIPMGMLSRQILLPITNTLFLPKLIRKHRCNLIFNLSDLPVPTNVCQVFLFDWPYAAFPDSAAWQRLNWFGWIARRTKLMLFRRYLRHVNLLIAQNDVIMNRLENLYDVAQMAIVPNAVSFDHSVSQNNVDFDFGPGVTLLCLSQYYPHKNIEILIPLANLIRSRKLNIRIVTTISANHGPQARKILDEITANQLGDHLCNIGPVPMQNVPSLFKNVDGLILPTLLESFSGTYVEAMYHDKPILTSDLDFAHGVCGECAFYFDPLDAESILSAILLMLNERELTMQKVRCGRQRLSEMPDWQDVCDLLISIFDNYSTTKTASPAG